METNNLFKQTDLNKFNFSGLKQDHNTKFHLYQWKKLKKIEDK